MRPSRRGAVALLGAAVACRWLPTAPLDAAPAPAATGSPLRLRRGISVWPWFSKTREAPPPATNYEWPPYDPARAIPTRRDLAGLHALGFDFIRLPVDPGPLMAFEGPRARQLRDEVLAAVESSLAAGLRVVLDLHPEGTGRWVSPIFDEAHGATARDRYLAVLTDLAGRLDPARVALEPMNEPPGSCGDPAWPLLQREIVAAVRRVAPRLTLVLTGTCGGMVEGLEALPPLADPNVIYGFHLYEPYLFTHQGAVWMTREPIYRYLNGVPWPADAGSRAQTKAAVRLRLARDTTTPRAEKDRIAAELERVLDQYFDARPDRWFVETFIARAKGWADRHAIAPERLLLGEFGALRSDAQFTASRPADRARYIRDVRQTAESYGIPWAFWDLFDGFGLYGDDVARDPDPAIVEALGLKRGAG